MKENRERNVKNIFARVKKRVRHRAGLRRGGIVLSLLSLILLIYLAGLRLGFLPLTLTPRLRLISLVLLTLPLAFYALAYLSALFKSVDLNRATFVLDRRLGTRELTSSLLSLEEEGKDGPFLSKIRERLSRLEIDLRKAFPLRKTDLIANFGGLLTLLLVLALAFLPASLPGGRSLNSPSLLGGRGKRAGEGRTDPARGEELKGEEKSPEEEEAGLNDRERLLRKVRELREGEGVVSREGDDLLRYLEEKMGGEGLVSNSSDLSDLEEMKREEERGLAAIDDQKLRSLLEELMESEDPGRSSELVERADRRLSQMKKEGTGSAAQSGEEGDREGTEPETGESKRSEARTGEGEGDRVAEEDGESGGKSEGQEEEKGSGAGGEENGDETLSERRESSSVKEGERREGETASSPYEERPEEKSPSSQSEPRTEEGRDQDESADFDRSGGDKPGEGSAVEEKGSSQAAPPDERSLTDTSPEFSLQRLPGKTASDPSFREYLTLGVPIETGESEVEDQGERKVNVDYQKLRSIFTWKSLSEEEEKIVRRYFDGLTRSAGQ